jgi:CobQ-like glutamine amidotransferase family enzyme
VRTGDVLAEATPDSRPEPGRGGRRSESTVGIALLFPELLGTYGDGGNALILAKRLEWRGIASEVITVEAGEVVPDSCDLYVLGGGEDGPQTEAARELIRQGALHRATERGAAVFSVCAGMQILGESFAGKDGDAVPGLGLLDCRTVKTDEPRAVGELLVEATPGDQAAGGLPGLSRLTGFENHGGRTRLGAGARPLGPVVAGVGNGDGGEGVAPRDPGGARVLGTYLHGPALARNPALADLLLGWVLGDGPAALAPVDDQDAERLRADRFRAVDAGRLDGVAHRSLRDRLLGRN